MVLVKRGDKGLTSVRKAGDGQCEGKRAMQWIFAFHHSYSLLFLDKTGCPVVVCK